jgi:hypothetical protein
MIQYGFGAWFPFQAFLSLSFLSFLTYTHTYIHNHTNTHMYIHTQSYTHTYIHTYILTYIHAYIHSITYTHSIHTYTHQRKAIHIALIHLYVCPVPFLYFLSAICFSEWVQLGGGDFSLFKTTVPRNCFWDLQHYPQLREWFSGT